MGRSHATLPVTPSPASSVQGISLNIRDWSLITGRGDGGTTREGGGGGLVKFYPYEKLC